VIPVLLWLLATLDCAFAGYREAAGRNALIKKRGYYRRALVRGALWAQLAVAITGVAILIWRALSNQPDLLTRDLEKVGAGMLTIYVPYTVIILVAFLIRALPSVDLRSITSTVIFGPFTLIRPFVSLAGVLWGIHAAPGPASVTLGFLVLVLMLGTERALGQIRPARTP